MDKFISDSESNLAIQIKLLKKRLKLLTKLQQISVSDQQVLASEKITAIISQSKPESRKIIDVINLKKTYDGERFVLKGINEPTQNCLCWKSNHGKKLV